MYGTMTTIGTTLALTGLMMAPAWGWKKTDCAMGLLGA